MTTQQIEISSEVVAEARVDAKTFGRLFDYFYPIIFAYCMRRLVLRAVAEDIASEVFLKVVNTFSEFPSNEVEEFRRWIFRIATNEINAHLRQTLRRKELLEAAVHLGHIETSETTKALGISETATWEDVYSALDALPTRDRSVVSLRFFASLSHQEIARTLDLKTGTVRVVLSRALAKMREHLRVQVDKADQQMKGAQFDER